jgi:hypothetical protein
MTRPAAWNGCEIAAAVPMVAFARKPSPIYLCEADLAAPFTAINAAQLTASRADVAGQTWPAEPGRAKARAAGGSAQPWPAGPSARTSDRCGRPLVRNRPVGPGRSHAHPHERGRTRRPHRSIRPHIFPKSSEHRHVAACFMRARSSATSASSAAIRPPPGEAGAGARDWSICMHPAAAHKRASVAASASVQR